MTHLRPEELLAWRDAPAAADRARIIGHLAACDACAAAYADLVRTRPAEVPPRVFQPDQFIPHGYGARAGAAGTNRSWRLLLPLAAAAAVVLALLIPWRAEHARPGPGGDVMRGSALEAQAPSGDVSGVLEFRWTSASRPDRYRLEIRDRAGDLVAVRETRAERLEADADLRERLRPGVEYTWTVTALDGAGETIARSEPRVFISPGAR